MLRDDGYRVWDGEVCVFEYKYSEHPQATGIVRELLAASSQLDAEVAARNRVQPCARNDS